ncbi:response regulator transcription factor [Aneurinibacillus sp. REN35]|uniref:response regulator transcription factor n=1 Tax=Aneurinibacillus sp. REN35 TaxID=3237286 RepID=UPI0035287D89
MRILLAEDDKKLGKLIAHMLTKEKYSVDWATDGEEAYIQAQDESYELLILDWMMPGKDGVAICRSLRASGYQGAILLLTARDAIDDRVCGLDAGADDYLVKPFDFAELFARIRSLLRRRQLPIAEDIIQIGELSLDCRQRIIQRGMETIQLTPREFQLLELLARNHGYTVPRDTILDRVWGYDAEVTSNTLDAFVRLLRKKIDCPNCPTLIRNVRGIGYKLEV